MSFTFNVRQHRSLTTTKHEVACEVGSGRGSTGRKLSLRVTFPYALSMELFGVDPGFGGWITGRWTSGPALQLAAATVLGVHVHQKRLVRDVDRCPQRAERGVTVVTGGRGAGSGPDRVVLAALVRLAALITGSPGADGLMEAVAETARELLGADSVSVSRLEEDRWKYRVTSGTLFRSSRRVDRGTWTGDWIFMLAMMTRST